MSIPAGLRKEESEMVCTQGVLRVSCGQQRISEVGGGAMGLGCYAGGGVLSFRFLLYIPYLAQPENCVLYLSLREQI